MIAAVSAMMQVQYQDFPKEIAGPQSNSLNLLTDH